MSPLSEILQQIEFNPHGYCPVCNGWNVDPERGSTPKVHTADCKLARLMKSPACTSKVTGWSAGLATVIVPAAFNGKTVTIICEGE